MLTWWWNRLLFFLIIRDLLLNLIMYNVPSVFDDSHKLELLRHSKNFNKKRINQIEVVPEYNILIILTGILDDELMLQQWYLCLIAPIV